MDYKKKYEDALKRAEAIIKVAADQDGAICFANTIFPELKESEDEKIRKEIISALKFANVKGVYDKHIAWLEKQCEQKSLNDVAKKITKNKETAMLFLKSCGIMNANGELADEYKIEQDKHKFTDKVEPKFKVGDWITNSIETVEVTGYDIDYGYQVDYKGNLQHRDTDIIEKEYHLWTIQDAKDGDVLFLDLMCGKTFIYNGINSDMAILYSFIISNDGKDVLPYYIGKPNTGIGNIEENKNIIHPATKEQRSILFQKIKEAGYEWDAEKKELKKFHIIDEGKSEMDYCFTKMMNGEKVNSAWSKEDERLRRKLIELIYSVSYCDERKNLSNWLKSLKQRIGR